MRARSWRAASAQDTFRMAKQLGINRLAASRMRKRFLRDQIRTWKQHPHPITELWLKRARAEIAELESKERFEPAPPSTFNRITDEMVEAARDYPANKLVAWTRNGNASAWCHLDTKPSLTYMDRINKLWCPVCNLYFDSIAVLMERDGYQFQDAVRELAA